MQLLSKVRIILHGVNSWLTSCIYLCLNPLFSPLTPSSRPSPLAQMDVDPSSPFPESGDDVNAVRSNSPAMETDETPAAAPPPAAASAAAPIQNVLAPRNPNSDEGPLTPAQIQVFAVILSCTGV